MQCEYFGKCGSCVLYDQDYELQIQDKVKLVKEKFNIDKSLEINKSLKSAFRNRAEFRIFHTDSKISYAMNGFDKSVVLIESCQIINNNIQLLMPKLIIDIEKISILENRLFSIEFLSTNANNQILVTLIYHKKLDEIWEVEARKIEKKFGIFIVGRARKQKIILSYEYITEHLNINNKIYKLNYYEASFTQPNTKVNEKMIEFAKKYSKDINGDLLELYCGCGNFTMALSENFDKVLATEISKKSIMSAKENMVLNNISNIQFARLSSQESIEAFTKKRVFKRLEHIKLDSYNFKAVFIDPPRSGVDDITLGFIARFECIIYISCNVDTLYRDLERLKNTHNITNWAIFDQFAYTKHIEMGVVLKIKDKK